MYADIVIDISHESLDRPFQYRIPESLVGQVQPGMWVLVPFGRRNTQKKGFVLKLGTKANMGIDGKTGCCNRNTVTAFYRFHKVIFHDLRGVIKYFHR